MQEAQLRPREDTKKLEHRISELFYINGNLKLELDSRPTQKEYKKLWVRLQCLEAPSLRKRAKSASPCTVGTITEILSALKLENAQEILPTLKALRSHKANSVLVQRLSALVKECAPPGTFHPWPSKKQIWKWIRRVIEDYLSLKSSL